MYTRITLMSSSKPIIFSLVYIPSPYFLVLTLFSVYTCFSKEVPTISSGECNVFRYRTKKFYNMRQMIFISTVVFPGVRLKQIISQGYLYIFKIETFVPTHEHLVTYLPQIFIEEIFKTTGIFLTWFNISNLVEYGIYLVSRQNYVPKKISACQSVCLFVRHLFKGSGN